MTDLAPLDGIVVVDLSRMLPGAVLARGLLDLGARLIKVEDRRTGGDPMRHMPPMVSGVGCGFSHFLAGAESIAIDLGKDAALVRRMARTADILIESFRPTTRARVGLEPEVLQDKNPGLIVCRLPAYDGPGVGHDLNFVAETGLLHALGTEMPNAQIADVSTGELARCAILAALLARHRSGRGAVIEQPLVFGPLPYLQWSYADAGAGPERAADGLIGGGVAAYRTYAARGGRIAVGCLEPKFWVAFCEAFELHEFAGRGLERDESGQQVVDAVQAKLSGMEAAQVVERCRARSIPVTAVRSPLQAVTDGPRALFETAAASGPAGSPGSSGTVRPAPTLPSFPRPTGARVPALGEHDGPLRAEFDDADE